MWRGDDGRRTDRFGRERVRKGEKRVDISNRWGGRVWEMGDGSERASESEREREPEREQRFHVGGVEGWSCAGTM